MRKRLLSGFLAFLLVVQMFTPQVYAAEVSPQLTQEIQSETPSPEVEAEEDTDETTLAEEVESTQAPEEEVIPEATEEPEAEATPEATTMPEEEETPEVTPTPEGENAPEAEETPEVEATPDVEEVLETETSNDFLENDDNLIEMAEEPIKENEKSLEQSSQLITVNYTPELIAQVGPQGKDMCMAYTLAYCRTIIDGIVHKGREYWQDNVGGMYSWADYTKTGTNDKQSFLKMIVNEINQGKPVGMWVTKHYRANQAWNANGDHWVAVIGYRSTADINNLKTSDFYIIDPGNCGYDYLSDNEDSFNFTTYNLLLYKYQVKDEPQVSKLTLTANKPEGNLPRGSSFTVTGTAQSNVKLKKIEVSITEIDANGNPSGKMLPPANIDLDCYNYSWGAHSEIDEKMTFKELGEGTYLYKVKVTDAAGKTKTITSKFTIVPKANENKVIAPTLILHTDKNTLDETSATRTALLTNPGNLRVTEAGMILYDESRNAIARCSEKLNDFRGQIWIYYATNSNTNVNLNINLTPGTKYYYDIYAYVNNEKYVVEGEFTTKGSSKPQTPVLNVDQVEYAAGDVATITWNSVDHVKDGYEVTLFAKDGSYTKTVDTKLTNASFVLPTGGEYDVSIIAKGYSNSDTGYLDKTLKAYDDCKVTFVEEAEDGTITVLKEEVVKYKRTATPPSAPTRTGWIFQGWDNSFTTVTKDVTVKAIFVRNTFKVVFFDIDGSVLKQERVPYEGYLEPPADPIPEPGFVFVGWDSDKYKYVTENTEIHASYVYENIDLPLQLNVDSCEFDSDATGYAVYYDVSNYDKGVTQGRAIVSLMTSDGRLVYTTESNAFSLKASQKKNNVEVFVPYTGEAAYAEVVIVASFNNSIPLSEKKTIDVIRTWSGWKTTAPPATATEIESRVEYRYQDKDTYVSSSPNLSGWQLERTEGYWGDYGAWSGWSRNQYWASDSRQVQSRTVTDQAAYNLQHYYFWKYHKSGVGWMYSYANRSGGAGVSGVEYHETWINTAGDNKTMVHDGYDDGYDRYICVPWQVYEVEFWYRGTGDRYVPAVTHTEWQCRDRQYLYRYHFYKWSNWSEWSTTPYTASATRRVEKQTVYRYKTDAAPVDEWHGELRTVSGKVSETLAGKQALLVVYKNEEPSDFNNEYLGQTTIGEDGSYSFTFFTREVPSVETGDFTVKLGIEGASELLYLSTIEAPKPEYSVKFVDWDGTILSEQTVTEGNSAVAPTEPVRAGHRFIGWSTGLTNVHDELSIMAMYEKEQCTVVFVDWSQDTFKTEQYDVGADIIYPVWKEVEGYDFMGWFDEAGNVVTKAEKNLVLTAHYEVKEYNVVFYNQSGEPISEQVVRYGQSALPPEAPAIEGQSFSSWSTYDYSSVKSDLHIYPNYRYYETTQNPSADIKSKTLEEPTAITLSCPDKDATIYYTLDGTRLDMFATEYTGPITIDKNVVLQFYARSENKNDSEIISEAYLMMNAEDDSGAVVIKKDKLNLLLGEEAPQITYFLYHENQNIGVEFHALNDSIVSVDEEGQLTVNNVGETQVFVVTKDYRYADYCDITVTSNEVEIETLDISKKNVDLFVGEEADLATRITPEDATYQDVIWNSADTDIVRINQDGHLVAEGVGGAYITAYSHAGKNIAYCYVNVEDTTLNLSEQEIVIAMGQKYQLNARIPGAEQTLTWKSDDKSVATVSAEGLVTGVIPGMATILVTAENGEFRTCTVRVTRGQIAAEPPQAPQVEDVTDTKIVLVKQEGCEYSLDAKVWQDSNEFLGLTQDTEYVAYSRVKATEETLASSASKGTVIRTEETKIVIAEIPEQIYTGKKVKPTVTVTYKGEELVAGKDYTVAYTNNTKASATAPKVTVTGKNFYTGSVSKKFVINKKNIAESDIICNELITAPSNKKQQLKPTLKYGTITLTEGKDYKLSYPDLDDGAYKNAGEWSITITGIGSFEGSRTVTMQITELKKISKTKISIPKAVTYDGEMHKPEVGVSYNNKALVKGTDYEISYPSEENGAYVMPGTYLIKITGIGDYTGSKTVNYKINGIKIDEAAVSGIVSEVEYIGEEITQDEMDVSLESIGSLVIDRDYEVAYAKNTNVGKATITITGINTYTGTIKKSFKIIPYNLKNDESGLVTFVSEPETVAFTKGGCKPVYEILFDGKLLVSGKDYTIKYKNNTSVNDGTNKKTIPTATITGKGNYSGTLTRTFVIEEQDLENLNITVADVAYKKNASYYKVVPTLYDLDGKKLVAGKDYDKKYVYSYADGSSIGKNEVPEAGSELQVTVKGKGSYAGVISATYRVGEKLINKAQISKIKKNYTGDEITLSASEIVVKIGKTRLVAGRDYVIEEDTYAKNTNPGTATVMIRGVGDYAGTVKVKYTIQKKRFF
ncbi:MAG: Ig-like domain-containing protein [Lachnospiraceae bacterium]|nr:Ig-like domain-containing protein [Lachnospiraceae bacterium]